MAREIPSLEALIERCQQSFRNAFDIDDATELGKNFMLANSVALAGILKPMYLRLSSVQKNILWDKAESEAVGGSLERFADLFLGRSKFDATQGTYRATINPSGDGEFHH